MKEIGPEIPLETLDSFATEEEIKNYLGNRSTKEFYEEINNALCSFHPLIYVRTNDNWRFLSYICMYYSLLKSRGLNDQYGWSYDFLNVWESLYGIGGVRLKDDGPIMDDPKTVSEDLRLQNPVDILCYIVNKTNSEIRSYVTKGEYELYISRLKRYFLFDYDLFMQNNPEIISRLRSMAGIRGLSKIVVVGNSCDIPKSLDGAFITIDFPSIGREELCLQLSRCAIHIYMSHKKRLPALWDDVENKQKMEDVADILTGLNGLNARRIVKMSIIKYGSINIDFIRDIREKTKCS